MPEVAVHKHRHTSADEEEVGCAAAGKPLLDGIPQSEAVDRASEHHLGRRVTPTATTEVASRVCG